MTLAWVVLCGLAGWRMEQTVRDLFGAWVAARYPVSASPAPVADLTVPDDLVALAMSYPETYQADVMAAVREKYEIAGDWNGVRRAFGIGARDA